MIRVTSLVRRFWVDALLVAAIAGATSVAVRSHGTPDGPEGPLWLDLLIILGFWGPLFFRRRFPIDFQIEGAKITALPAEWYMEIKSDRSRHYVSENGMGFEKSLVKTISISSVEEIPRLRTCSGPARGSRRCLAARRKRRG